MCIWITTKKPMQPKQSTYSMGLVYTRMPSLTEMEYFNYSTRGGIISSLCMLFNAVLL